MKKTNAPVELTDEDAGKVNGGMKIILFDKPKFLDPILRLIFKIKKTQPDKTDSDTVITGPVIASGDNDADAE